MLIQHLIPVILDNGASVEDGLTWASPSNLALVKDKIKNTVLNQVQKMSNPY